MTRTLEQAWQAYQPDQPLSPAVSVRRRPFVFQALLLSAGMYDEPPSDPARVYAEYAPQFVRDFGMSRNPGLAAALGKLSETLEQVRERPDTDLGSNCGLILARRALREDPVNVFTALVTASAGSPGVSVIAPTELAVAMNARSAYLTAYLHPWVRRVAALDDAGLVELGAAVMHYVSFNTIAHGMLLDPPFTDMRAEDFRPGGRLANAPGPGAPPPPS